MPDAGNVLPHGVDREPAAHYAAEECVVRQRWSLWPAVPPTSRNR